MNLRSLISKYFLPSVVGLVYAFLYIPIIVLIVFSFNANEIGFSWLGFTTDWYTKLWYDTQVWQALYNSLIIAISAVVLSITMSSLFIFFGPKKYIHRALGLFYLNLAIPEIVLGIGLMSLFYFCAIPLSFTTLIASHTVLGLGYVIPIMYTQYIELDRYYLEASMDLGATKWQTFRLIVLPLLYPSMITAALLVFIISFDNFILSFFCSGGSTQTLPMYIFAMIRTGGSPIVSALSTILLISSSLIVLIFLWIQLKKTRMLR